MDRLDQEGEDGAAVPEPKFGKLWEQEEAHSRRIKLVLGVLLGPAVLLALLGHYDAAAMALVASVFLGFLLLRVLAKLDRIDL